MITSNRSSNRDQINEAIWKCCAKKKYSGVRNHFSKMDLSSHQREQTLKKNVSLDHWISLLPSTWPVCNFGVFQASFPHCLPPHRYQVLQMFLILQSPMIWNLTFSLSSVTLNLKSYNFSEFTHGLHSICILVHLDLIVLLENEF